MEKDDLPNLLGELPPSVLLNLVDDGLLDMATREILSHMEARDIVTFLSSNKKLLSKLAPLMTPAITEPIYRRRIQNELKSPVSPSHQLKAIIPLPTPAVCPRFVSEYEARQSQYNYYATKFGQRVSKLFLADAFSFSSFFREYREQREPKFSIRIEDEGGRALPLDLRRLSRDSGHTETGMLVGILLGEYVPTDLRELRKPPSVPRVRLVTVDPINEITGETLIRPRFLTNIFFESPQAIVIPTMEFHHWLSYWPDAGREEIQLIRDNEELPNGLDPATLPALDRPDQFRMLSTFRPRLIKAVPGKTRHLCTYAIKRNGYRLSIWEETVIVEKSVTTRIGLLAMSYGEEFTALIDIPASVELLQQFVRLYGTLMSTQTIETIGVVVDPHYRAIWKHILPTTFVFSSTPPYKLIVDLILDRIVPLYAEENRYTCTAHAGCSLKATHVLDASTPIFFCAKHLPTM